MDLLDAQTGQQEGDLVEEGRFFPVSSFERILSLCTNKDVINTTGTRIATLDERSALWVEAENPAVTLATNVNADRPQGAVGGGFLAI